MGTPRRICKFGHDTAVTGRYPGGNCAECSRARSRQWNVDNPGRIRNRNLMRLYGVNAEEYDALLRAQGGVCRGCGDPPKRTMLCVDHDHSTGAVRGLLCHTCNRLLGLAKDDPEVLRTLASYVEAA